MIRIIQQNRGISILALLILSNLLIKVIPASLLELGNDEVYYLTYARYPDWSHFDHPPMVGLIIQLFSLNLKWTDELILRSGPLILSSLSMLFLYLLVKRIYSERAAIFAVILFSGSFYFNIISGLFIMPDTPQVFFTVIALFYLFPALTNPGPGRKENVGIILFGIFTGFAFLSKYHALFLWAGAGLYIIFHNRVWLRKPSLYVSGIFTMVLMLPVLYWNFQNDFISFSFHGNRIGLGDKGINLLLFLRFTLGQILYQNPIIFIVCIYAVAAFFKTSTIRDNTGRALLYLSIPLIAFFTLSSLFKNTFPHWTGPAFLPLIILSSGFLDKSLLRGRRFAPGILVISSIIFYATLAAGTLQIHNGIFSNGDSFEPSMKGKNDFTLDMYGWRQSGDKFHAFLETDNNENLSSENIALLSDRWFPGAHIDHYIAIPNNLNMFVAGDIDKSHKYYQINQLRKKESIKKLYYLTDSRNYVNPLYLYNNYTDIILKDTIAITRKTKVVKYLFIYEIITEGDLIR